MPEEKVQKTPAEVADLLDRTAQWLEDHKWVRGTYASYEVLRDPETKKLIRDPQVGGYKRGLVGACAVGAMRVAAGMDELRPNQGAPTEGLRFGADVDLYEAGMDEMARCLRQWGDFTEDQREDLGEDASSEDVIPTWNDSSGRTGEEVIAMFRRCAERVRSGRPVKEKKA